MIDANQPCDDKTQKMCYVDLVEQVELDPSLDDQEARVVPSRQTGKSVIDHIDTYGISKENVLAC